MSKFFHEMRAGTLRGLPGFNLATTPNRVELSFRGLCVTISGEPLLTMMRNVNGLCTRFTELSSEDAILSAMYMTCKLPEVYGVSAEPMETSPQWPVDRNVQIAMPALIGEYDKPEDTPEWQWVEKHATFSHVKNRVEGGVFEFFVHVPELLDDGEFIDGMPEKLIPVFNFAKLINAGYVCFFQ